MRRLILSVTVMLFVLAGAGSAVTSDRAYAQPDDEAARALQAARRILGGVDRAECRAPATAGTPCVEPVTGEMEVRTLPRGIATFSVTFVDEPGSYIAVFGRTAAGEWGYWFGAQDQQSPLLTLPGELLACGGPDGGPARLYRPARGGSEPLQPLTRLRAEEFVLTQSGRPGTELGDPGVRGLGWYRVSAPAEGWAPEQDITAAVLDDCTVHDIQYGPRSTLPVEGGDMNLGGTIWTWQRTALTNDEVLAPADPSSYTVEFLAEGRVSVQADCNRGAGSYTVDGSRLTISPLALTRAACPPGSLSNQFVAQLQDAVSYALQGGDLLLELKSGGGVMRFVPAGASEDTVTGVVTYRERIALPPDAVATVQIQDVSLADAPARVIGEQVIAPAGQVPISFAVGYRPSEIDPRFRYIVRAEIRDGSGRLLFTTTMSYPVITLGNLTKDIEIVVERVN